jgi:hypothetical protein
MEIKIRQMGVYALLLPQIGNACFLPVVEIKGICRQRSDEKV